MHVVATNDTIFNEANLLVSALRMNIIMEQVPEECITSELYMASYFLDAVSDRCQFDRWPHVTRINPSCEKEKSP